MVIVLTESDEQPVKHSLAVEVDNAPYAHSYKVTGHPKDELLGRSI